MSVCSTSLCVHTCRVHLVWASRTAKRIAVLYLVLSGCRWLWQAVCRLGLGRIRSWAELTAYHMPCHMPSMLGAW